MADARPLSRAGGFSLVEMMIALVFTLVLMAGMATVFKASLSTFYTSGETMASSRRNRLSVNLLADDLNVACMYLESPDYGPSSVLTAANPPFYVLPNVSVTGAPSPGAPGDAVMADELYFVMDQALPFQGTLAAQGTTNNNLMVNGGVAAAVGDMTFTIETKNPTYAGSVQQGQKMIFMDSAQAYLVSSVTPPGPTDTRVTVVLSGENNSFITGTGATTSLPVMHLKDSGALFIQPLQMVRYRLEYLLLDPTSAAGIPCLVRDQGAYNGNGFVAVANQRQIITENVQGFKVYLSTNGGQTWAGLGLAPAIPLPAPGGGFANGWTNGIRTLLDQQLSTGVGAVPASGRPGFTSTQPTTDMGENWFRFIPTLVRVDVSTRSATQRTEYFDPANPTVLAPFKTLTQTLIFMPRQSGLTLGWK